MQSDSSVPFSNLKIRFHVGRKAMTVSATKLKRYLLTDRLTVIREVRRRHCVRVPYMTFEPDGDAYCYAQLLLYVLFRAESQLIAGYSNATAAKVSLHDVITTSMQDLGFTTNFVERLDVELTRLDDRQHEAWNACLNLTHQYPFRFFPRIEATCRYHLLAVD